MSVLTYSWLHCFDQITLTICFLCMKSLSPTQMYVMQDLTRVSSTLPREMIKKRGHVEADEKSKGQATYEPIVLAGKNE